MEQLCPIGPAARGGRGSGASALWSASRGMARLIGALTLAYDEADDRKSCAARPCAGPDDRRPSRCSSPASTAWWRPTHSTTRERRAPRGRAAGPAVAGPRPGRHRWPVAAATDGGRTATRAQFRWVSPGRCSPLSWGWPPRSASRSIRAEVGDYDGAYGALGAIVVVMLWLYITAYMVILGAELNCELERATVVDTTTGPRSPLGERRPTPRRAGTLDGLTERSTLSFPERTRDRRPAVRRRHGSAGSVCRSTSR